MLSLVSLVVVAELLSYVRAEPRDFLPVPEYVRSKGYPCENHTVMSPDGYVLTIHRIPHGLSSQGLNTTERPAVILHHGFMLSSVCWVLGPSSRALGHILADAGFDVWMTNARGSTYSKRHVNMSDRDPSFWDFSFDEMALRDLPVIVDYVTNVTGKEKVSYVGHSMGTTIFFAAMAGRPELNSKIKVMIGLAPATNLSTASAPLVKLLQPFAGNLFQLLTRMGFPSLSYPSPDLYTTQSNICRLNHITRSACQIFISLFAGFDLAEWDESTYQAALASLPAGASYRTFMHFIQFANTGKFGRYDFGTHENFQRYNSLTPPEYNLGNVTAPVALFWALNDWLADPQDVETLEKKLPNLIGSFQVPWPLFTHIDFVWAKDAVPLLFNNVIKILLQYS